jgi:PGF-pre-PGF domain-containing protein
LLIAFFILILCIGIGTAAEIIVESGSSIQAAVNNATLGDTITIKPGTYNENVKIVTDSLTIRSESGNPDDTMIKAKTTTDNALYVKADNVKISGIKAAAATGSSASGICLSGCNNCVIEKNKPTVNGQGIYLVSSTGCTVSGNTVINCGYFGIVLGDSKSNIITGNTVTNSKRGIYIGSSDNNTVSGNTVTLNSVLGFYSCSLCDENRIYNNYFNNTEISVKSGSGNSYNATKTPGTNIIGGSYIGGNYWGKPDGTGFSDTALDNDGDGISDSAYSLPGSSYSDYLPLVYPSNSPEPILPVADFSSDVTSGNAPLTVIFKDRSTGDPTEWDWDFGDGNVSTEQSPVHTYISAGTYTVKLTVSNADGAASTDGTITVLQNPEPTIEPVLPVADFSSDVTSGNAPLDVSFADKSTGTPTAWYWDFGDGTTSIDQSPVHTYSSAGDYIVNLTVSNVNGTASKTGAINVLQNPEPSPNPVLPVADFGTNATQGPAPLVIQFTDLSQNAVYWSWDFDNNGQPDSTIQSPVYVYTYPGTYTVNLVATNENGTAKKSLEIKVLTESNSGGGSSKGGSSSGGGGGGGGSPEPAKNVEVKELAQVFITNGKAVKFDFTKNATCVVYVGFDAKKNVGKTTTIVEQLKNKSALVSKLPDGEIYKSFNVWVGNSGYVSSKNIENLVICFKVEKSWLQEKGVDQTSIILNRYDEKKWGQLPANLIGEDDRYLYFTADVPGYASFTITGKAIQQIEEESARIPAEKRSVGEIQSEKNEPQEAEPNENDRRDTLISVGVVIGALGVVAVVLKSMKG